MAELTDCPLSPRQHEAILGVIRGRTYQTIADEMHVAHCTVRTHIHAAYRRLAVNSAAQARTVMIREGWLTLADTLLPDDDRFGPTYTRISRRGCRNWLPTPAQRLYLDAFDRLLHTRSEEAAGDVDFYFGVLCRERRCPDPRRGGQDIDEMLARLAWAALRPIPA